MKLPTPLSIKDFAQQFGVSTILGDEHLLITGINEIHKVTRGDLTFVDTEKYYSKVLQSAASVILINKGVPVPKGKALLVVDQPFEIYNRLVRQYRPFQPLSTIIGDSAVIHPSTIIEPNVIIGNQVRIGKNCYIQANVTIRNFTTIGDNVRIESGSVIGADAFYFKPTEEGYQKWVSGGYTVIEDNVFIGANCTICKGVSGATRLGAGTKLDSQVHIGHGAVIGKNCLMAAQVGIGGKVIIGDNVILYGQVGVAARLTIGANATVLAKSGVTKNLKADETYFGYPAGETKRLYKELAALRSLPKLIKAFYKKGK
ncbi:MAG: UDP-3-O-(3-hydroxymyristoyl)glucosamine N-acyltransferase [Bacteroidota bacterium]